MGNYTPTSGRTRSALTLTWLWIAFVIYTCNAIFYLIFSYGTTIFNGSVVRELFAPYCLETAIAIGMIGIMTLLCSWSVALLLKSRRWAIYPLLGCTFFNIVMALGVFDNNPFIAIHFVVVFLLTFLSLLIPYRGRTAWRAMDGAFDWKHCRHLNIIYIIAFVIFLVLTIAAFAQAPTYAKSYDDYSSYNYDDYDNYDNSDEVTPEENYADSAVAEEPAQEGYSVYDVVQQVNRNLPMDLGNGLVLSRAEVSGNYVVYVCDVDEDYVSIDNLRNNSYEVKSNIRSTIANTSDDPFLPYLKNLGMGVAYKYVGTTSGDEVYIEFSPEEVAEM